MAFVDVGTGLIASLEFHVSEDGKTGVSLSILTDARSTRQQKQTRSFCIEKIKGKTEGKRERESRCFVSPFLSSKVTPRNKRRKKNT